LFQSALHKSEADSVFVEGLAASRNSLQLSLAKQTTWKLGADVGKQVQAVDDEPSVIPEDDDAVQP